MMFSYSVRVAGLNLANGISLIFGVYLIEVQPFLMMTDWTDRKDHRISRVIMIDFVYWKTIYLFPPSYTPKPSMY